MYSPPDVVVVLAVAVAGAYFSGLLGGGEQKKIAAEFDSDVLSKIQCCVLADFIEGMTG